MAHLLTRKLGKDIVTRRGQFAFMAVAVALAVYSLSTMLGGYSILRREVRASYLSTNPAQATIVLDRIDEPLHSALAGKGFSDDLSGWEARGALPGRIRRDKGWTALLIFVIDDFTSIRVGKAFPQEGAWPPPSATLLVERSAMDLIGARIGDTVIVSIPDAGERPVRLAGTAHDPGLAPAWQEQTVYAYADASTVSQWIGHPFVMDQLKVVFRDIPVRERDIRARAESFAGQLTGRGYTVREIQVPPPETHPHQSQMNTIMLTFLVFAGLSLLLSAVLLAAVLRTILGTETRMIGIMKAIGGGTTRIAGHYLSMAAAPAVVGSAVAIPLGAITARGMSTLVAGLLNVDIVSLALPAWVVVVALGAGILVPLLLAALPVLAATRMSVREALSPLVLGRPSRRQTRRPLPPMPAMALRNVGRRPARLALSLGLLGIAGGVFMTSMNIQAGWTRTIERSLSLRRFELEVRLTGPINADTAIAALAQVPGVHTAEPRPLLPVYADSGQQYPLSHVYPDQGHGSFSLRAIPPVSQLVELPILQGRLPADGEGPRDALPEVAINQNARVFFPSASIGSPISLFLGGTRQCARLVGVVQEFAPAAAYMTQPAMTRFMQGSNAFLVSFDKGSGQTVDEMQAACDSALRGAGARISQGLPEEAFSTAIGAHTRILIIAMLLMAVVMGVVGMIGLAAALGASVVERTRETGVLRALGAGSGRIAGLLVSEAELTGAISLGIALVISLPLTRVLGTIFGQMSFRLPIDFVISPTGLVIWLVGCLVGAALSCAAAVRTTLKRPLPQALAWE